MRLQNYTQVIMMTTTGQVQQTGPGRLPPGPGKLPIQSVSRFRGKQQRAIESRWLPPVLLKLGSKLVTTLAAIVVAVLQTEMSNILSHALQT